MYFLFLLFYISISQGHKVAIKCIVHVTSVDILHKKEHAEVSAAEQRENCAYRVWKRSILANKKEQLAVCWITHQNSKDVFFYVPMCPFSIEVIFMSI